MTEEVTVTSESNGQEPKDTETPEEVQDSDAAKDKESTEEEYPDRDGAIVRQIEYYFGDLNLPRDKFLREQVKLDDGWIPLELLTKFQRLARITKDVSIIANAVKNSSSDLLEVSEDDTKLRRNPEHPLPEYNEERRKELLARTAYAKGFPKDSVFDDILKFFKDFKGIANLYMRKYRDNKSKKRMFKGSVFVTFETKEQAEEFVKTKDLKYGDKELLILRQEDYINQKNEEYSARREKKDKKKNPPVEEKPEIVLPSGTTLHFTTTKETLKREDVKEAIEELGGEVAFINFQMGDKEGWVRLTIENQAKEVFGKIKEGKLKVSDSEIAVKLLEGDEEKDFLQKSVEAIMNRRRNSKQKSRGHVFRGKHGRKRKHEREHGDGPQNKMKANR